MFPATNFRLKRLKKSPLPFQHHKAILQLDHNTSPKSSSTTTTTKPPPLNSEITPTQSASTNTPSSITVATTTANTATTTTNHTISTFYTSTTANTTTTTTHTSTQTDKPIPALTQLNIPIPSRIHTPSTPITIPLSSSIAPSSIAPSPIFSPAVGTLGGSPAIRTTTKGGHHHLAFLKTPRTQGTDKDAHSTHTYTKFCSK